MLIVFGLKTKIALWKLLFSMVIFKKKFIEYPPGMVDAEEDNVLPLNKCIYGLVQAARQYHELAVEVLHKIGFNAGQVEHVCSRNNMKSEFSLWQYMWMTT